jgi:glycogen operon protein
VTSSAVRRGKSSPLGASVEPDGVNFSVFSRSTNRTYHYWHVFVQGIGPGQLYGLRHTIPFEPSLGLRFDPQKLPLDPYALGVAVPEGVQPPGGAPRWITVPTRLRGIPTRTSRCSAPTSGPRRRLSSPKR